MNKIAVIHGPNLNMLGTREPEVYGLKKLEEINEEIKKKASILNLEVNIFQSNHEGEIVDYVQKVYNKFKGIIINPAGLTHYSIVLQDVLVATKLPIIEVHISNIYRREGSRQKSVIASIAVGQIAGLGSDSYLYALEAMGKIIRRGSY